MAPLVSACAHTPTADAGETAQMGLEPAERIAALLVAAEKAGPGARRDIFVRHLDAFDVQASEAEQDDPLSRWRQQAKANGAPAYRGRALGPAYRQQSLPAGQQTELQQIFYAGQVAEIAAEANGGQPVGFQVTDTSNKSVCDTRLAPRGKCRWMPVFTDRYSIRLDNRSGQATSIYIVVK